MKITKRQIQKIIRESIRRGVTRGKLNEHINEASQLTVGDFYGRMQSFSAKAEPDGFMTLRFPSTVLRLDNISLQRLVEWLEHEVLGQAGDADDELRSSGIPETHWAPGHGSSY